MIFVLLCQGCVIEGDAIVNHTGQDVRVVLMSKDGLEKQLILKKGAAFAERRRKVTDEGFRYYHVRAYRMNGQLIGELRTGEGKQWRQKYGKYVRVIVEEKEVRPLSKAEFSSRN